MRIFLIFQILLLGSLACSLTSAVGAPVTLAVTTPPSLTSAVGASATLAVMTPPSLAVGAPATLAVMTPPPLMDVFATPAVVVSCCVLVANLNLRAAPGAESPILATLHVGDVLILSPALPLGSWVSVQTLAGAGWVNSIFTDCPSGG